MNEKQALLRFCATTHWQSIVALSLNLKQSFRDSNGDVRHIDELTAKKQFKRYIHVLNRRIYNSAYRHRGKRLKVIPILEKSENDRYHYHIAIEPPLHIDDSSFGEIAMETWLATELGYGHGEISTNADFGWLEYMAKRRTKSDFEHYFDCIDTDSYCN